MSDERRADSKVGEGFRDVPTLHLHDEPGAAPQATGSLPLVTNSPLPLTISSNSRRSRGGQPRSATRAQEATDKDEASMRPNKLEDLRRERVRWRKQAEERQRFQDKKEEAWEFFCRPATPRPRNSSRSSSRRYTKWSVAWSFQSLPRGENANWKPGGGIENGARGRQLPMPSHMAQDTRASRFATTSEINPLQRRQARRPAQHYLVSSVETALQ